MENLDQYFLMLCGFALVISHGLANCPPAITEKIPNWLMVVVNILAANYNQTKNANTDLKGNSNEGTGRNR